MIGLLLALVLPASGAEVVLRVGEHDLTEVLAQAQAGDRLVLGPGEWMGPVVIDAAITLSSAGGVLVGKEGTTVKVLAPGVVLDGLVIRGSGVDLQGPDACVWVGPEATGTIIRDSEITDCLFGIWLHQVRGVQVLDNVVTGRSEAPMHEKGNGIHLFDSDQLVVAGNSVAGARDGIFVSATENSVISRNTVTGQRFGIHYMYSYDNVIEGNIARDNGGGIALMGSLRLTVRDNVATGSSRHGILFRDVQYTTITGNRVEDNTEGMFFFSSLDNEIAYNTFAHNQVGVRIWAGTERNEVHDNAFVGNREQVFYVASQDQSWGSNYWSDYLGWDQDGDGFGDRPYRNDALTAQLLNAYPAATLLLNSPGLELIRLLQQQLPTLRPPTVLDVAPLLVAPGGRP